jgi:hypothetical protein
MIYLASYMLSHESSDGCTVTVHQCMGINILVVPTVLPNWLQLEKAPGMYRGSVVIQPVRCKRQCLCTASQGCCIVACGSAEVTLPQHLTPCTTCSHCCLPGGLHLPGPDVWPFLAVLDLQPQPSPARRVG